jgi:hypothetical protein
MARDGGNSARLITRHFLRFNDPLAKAFGVQFAAVRTRRGGRFKRIRGPRKPWRRRHVATARVLLRDISKILFPDNPVNVPVIK